MLTAKTLSAYRDIEKTKTPAKALIVGSRGHRMATLFKLLLSPWGFAILFLGPLRGEGLTLSGILTAGVDARLIGVALALIWATLAVWRGTWVGIKP